MDRNQAKEFYPILQAFAEGRVIECRTKPSVVECSDIPNDWTEMAEIEFWNNTEYRIKQDSKAEAKYRPFKNVEECWAEMKKHQPFGWIKNNCECKNISSIRTNKALRPILINIEICGEPYENSFNMAKMLEYYTFVDGTPFGIKEE